MVLPQNIGGYPQLISHSYPNPEEEIMQNYLLLYSGGSMPASEDEQKAVLKDWTIWFGTLGVNLVDGGNPFTPAAKNISSDGKVIDGPTGGMASGYSVVKANSLDEAVGMAKGCPVLKGGAKITVFETFNAMG
jgi:hypothetical protein